MRKITYLLVICLFAVNFSGLIAFSDTYDSITITINGEIVEFNEDLGYPFADSNSRTQVPFRATLEAFEAKVSWDYENSRAVAQKDGIKVEVPIGEKYIFRNGEKIESDTTALVLNQRTYLPIRVVMEAFGCEVSWNGESKTVIIQEKEKHYIEMDMTEVFEEKKVKVTYKEKINGTKKLSYRVAWEGNINFTSTVKPFIVGEKGKFQAMPDERKVEFTLRGDNEYIEYGYYYTLEKGVMPLGYFLEDFGYISVRNTLDSDFLEKHGYYLTIKKPDNIDVYPPFELIDLEKNTYYIPKSTNILNQVGKGGTIIFGNFDNTEQYNFGDHTLTMLSKGIDENHISKSLSLFVYRKFMDAVFNNNQEYLNTNYAILYVGEDYEFIRAEGMRGAQIERVSDYEIIPKKVNNADSYEMFIDYPNIKEVGRLFVHQLVHTTFDDEIPGWWSIEGLAEYMMPLMLKEYGILTEEQEREVYMDVINFYNQQIVAKGIDIPMSLIVDRESIEELESKYSIDFNIDEISKPEVVELNAGKDYKWTYDNERTGWFTYIKGSLVFLYLDEYIQEHTDGEKDIFDLLNCYLTRKKEEEGNYNLVESVVSNLTNTDFTGFFEKHVLDNQPLPLKVENQKIILD